MGYARNVRVLTISTKYHLDQNFYRKMGTCITIESSLLVNELFREKKLIINVKSPASSMRSKSDATYILLIN